MAILHPFCALRPQPEKVEEIACVPYDVVNTQEARELAENKPLSFLHVIRPEIDLPFGIDEHADEVYEKGVENLRAYAKSDISVQEHDPSVYVYRLVMDGRDQTGIFGCVAVEEYDNDTILKHEKTRPAKENDRTRHILTQRAHAEPVMLTYWDHPRVKTIVDETKAGEPLYDFTAIDGIRHTIWRVEATMDLVEAFKDVAKLYVADGHHRCKAASRAAAELGAKAANASGDEYAYFPAVLFPVNEMMIMSYNRIVRTLPAGKSAFLKALSARLYVQHNSGEKTPDVPGKVCVYVDGVWHTVMLPLSKRTSAVDLLDVARLNEYILQPLLSIDDPRTDPNLDFIGGIRGTKELERLVDDRTAEVAFSMYPTSVEQLIDVSDAGLLMPPKSTWFEPKLRSGLLVHLFD